MARAYWVVCYRSISNPVARDEYTKLAVPAVLAGGGRFLARGNPAKTYEAGIDQRTVLVEFDSLTQAIATHDGPGYQDITGNVTAEELVSFKEKHPVESIWAALQPPFSFSWYSASRFGDQAVVPLLSQSRNNLAL